MAVRDIYGTGGRIPQPKGDDEVTKVIDKDSIDEAVDIAGKALKVRAAELLVGGKQPVTAERTEKPVDVAAIIAAQTSQINNLMTNLVGVLSDKGKPKSEGENQFLTYLVGELKDMKGKLDNTPDPVQAVMQNAASWEALTKQFKEHLGIPGIGVGGPNDMKIMLDLETMKGEREERQRQWSAERDDLHHRWDIEDKKWKMDYDLALTKLGMDKTQKDQAGGMFGDLLGSVIDGIDAKRKTMGGVKVTREASTAVETPTLPKYVTCEKCQKTIPVPEGFDVSQPLKCECGEVYHLVPQ